MKKLLKRHTSIVTVIVAALFSVRVGLAQIQTGSLYGSVVDPVGAALPGATITLDTGAAPLIQTSGPRGEFRFPSLGPDLYATALISHVYGGISLIPESGLGPDVPAAFIDAAGVAHNTYLFDRSKRPQTQERLEGAMFADTGKLSHELKFGASYRLAEALTELGWPGGGYIIDQAAGGIPAPPGDNDLFVTRDALGGVTTKYTTGFVADTVTAGNLTANLGLRYDVQTARNLAASAPANPLLPDLLPAVSYPGGPVGFRWSSLNPRLGLTWALGKNRQTLVHASYSRYADQLSQDLSHAGGAGIPRCGTAEPGLLDIGRRRPAAKARDGQRLPGASFSATVDAVGRGRAAGSGRQVG